MEKGNNLSSLNEHLFAQLERLGKKDISPDELALEVNRSKAIAELAGHVVANAAVVLKAHALATGQQHGDLPKMLSGGM